jgi:hypothetical protein
MAHPLAVPAPRHLPELIKRKNEAIWAAISGFSSHVKADIAVRFDNSA